MKLSEAIRLGIGVVKNDRSLWLIPRDNGPCGCAIGTALYAAGKAHGGWVTRGIEKCHETWPWTAETYKGTITIAQELSMRHGLGASRESLADWIESLEVQQMEVESTTSKEVTHETERSYITG